MRKKVKGLGQCHGRLFDRDFATLGALAFSVSCNLLAISDPPPIAGDGARTPPQGQSADDCGRWGAWGRLACAAMEVELQKLDNELRSTQDLEAGLLVGAFDDFQLDRQPDELLRELGAGIATVSKDLYQAQIFLQRPLNQISGITSSERRCPSVSTRAFRLMPLIFLPAS